MRGAQDYGHEVPRTEPRRVKEQGQAIRGPRGMALVRERLGAVGGHRPVGMDGPQVVLVGAPGVAFVGDLRAIRRPARRALDGIRAVGGHGEQVPAALAVALEDDPLPVGREGRLEVVPYALGQVDQARAVRIHAPDILLAGAAVVALKSNLADIALRRNRPAAAGVTPATAGEDHS